MMEKKAKLFRVVYSGNASDIGRICKAIKYQQWGGYTVEFLNGDIVTLGLGDLEELDMDDWGK